MPKTPDEIDPTDVPYDMPVSGFPAMLVGMEVLAVTPRGETPSVLMPQSAIDILDGWGLLDDPFAEDEDD